MNNSRRKRLRSAKDMLIRASEIISFAVDEEQDALDNIPESLQYGERYEKIYDSCSALEYAQDGIEEVIEKLNDAML